jgi:hypothetical protein
MAGTTEDKGFAGFPVSMAQSEEDVKRAALQFFGKVFILRWSESPEGNVIDPIPNPKRYLVFGLSLGFVRFMSSLDFGTPGWFSSRVHNTGTPPAKS